MRYWSEFILSYALVAVFIPTAMWASETCSQPPLAGQHRDVETVQKLEIAWSIAYLRGDTDFEKCLLTPNFTEIMRNGQVKGLEDELGFARVNANRNLPIPDLPKSLILMHGDVAVGYGTQHSKTADGQDISRTYADYYVWEQGRWRAYFAQWTEYPTPAAAAVASTADEFLGLRLAVGQKIGNVFSKTVSYEGGGIDDQADRVSGSELYEVVDASPTNPKFITKGRYDGKPTHTSRVEVRNEGTKVCSLTRGMCRKYLDDSGSIYDSFFWGMPTGSLEVGMTWRVVMAEPWELGPAATQTVTVVDLDRVNGKVTLKREGEGDGPFADDPKQIAVKKAGKEFLVEVVPGTAHWTGYTVFQHGVTVSDELLETRTLTVNSNDFGTATISERQFTLLNQSPAGLL